MFNSKKKKSTEFQEKVKIELRNAKRIMMAEKGKSALSAVGFSVGLAYVLVEPFSLFTLAAVVAIVYFGRKFKGTVKKQFILSQQIIELKSSMSEKVWTPED